MKSRRAAFPRKETFATLIHDSRIIKDWSIPEAAERCQYSVQQWRNFEKGLQHPQLTRLQLICDMLGIDALRAFRIWALETLNQPQNLRIARLLGQLEPDDSSIHREPNTVHQQPTPQDEVIKKLRELPLDEATGAFAFRIVHAAIQEVLRYRNDLIRPQQLNRGVRVRSKEFQDSAFAQFPGMKLTMQCPVSHEKSGLGFLSTIVLIPPQCGFYHVHDSGMFFTSGMEFFTIIDGEGWLLVQKPAPKKWSVIQVAAGAVGSYPGSNPHVFVSTGTRPLRISVVVFPYPPSLENVDRLLRYRGTATAVEFSLDEMSTCRLPPDLMQELVALPRNSEHISD